MTAVAALDPGVEWLLRSDEPVIRFRTLVDLVGASMDDRQVIAARRAIPDGRFVSALLADALGEGRHPYSKWGGAHWRLVALMDLGVPADVVDMRPALQPVFDWLTGQGHRSAVKVIKGRARRCASQEGNALAVAVHLGLADDPRARLLATSLAGWQWPDGGWNCDKREAARHSSFHESLPALRGVAAFARATGEPVVAEAAARAIEFLLRHRVAFSERTGEPISPAAIRLHYPPYWRYDMLAGLRVLAEADQLRDPRASEALDLLESKRSADGTWAVEGVHFRRPGSSGSNVEVVDWGRTGASEPVTFGTLFVLRAAGRR